MTHGPTPHVLVVDDDQPTREVLRLILEDADYAVMEASSAHAALDLLRSTTERVVALFDHLMPGMDGLHALRVIATDRGLARAHAYVFITADMRPLSQDDMMLLAGLHCPVVRKPFDLDTLLAVIAQQLSLLRDTQGGEA